MRAKMTFAIFLLMFTVAINAQDKKYIVSTIIIKGNKVTKNGTITRELSFSEGDSVTIAGAGSKAVQSQENLLNTSLFNYVKVVFTENSSASLIATVEVEERWYIWPRAILKYDDRNLSAWLKEGDISRSLYGITLDKFNCFGRKETMRISYLGGYATQFSFTYRGVALDRKKRHYAGMEIELRRNDEVVAGTNLNEPILFTNEYKTVFERRKYTVNYTFRPEIRKFHNFWINYYDYRLADTVIRLNPWFLYQAKQKAHFLTFDYVYTSDHRDSKAYPLNGSLFETLVSQTISLPASSDTFLSTSFSANYFRYFPVRKNLWFATGINMKLTFNNQRSYLFSRSMGFNYNMHGFEYNTVDGEDMIIVKDLIKFAVINPRVTTLSFIPLSKFNKIHYALYLNLFSDLGYVSDRFPAGNNTYVNSLLASCGAGIDLVTYYDSTLRADFSITRFGKAGFYLNLTAPINNR